MPPEEREMMMNNIAHAVLGIAVTKGTEQIIPLMESLGKVWEDSGRMRQIIDEGDLFSEKI